MAISGTTIAVIGICAAVAATAATVYGSIKSSEERGKADEARQKAIDEIMKRTDEGEKLSPDMAREIYLGHLEQKGVLTPKLEDIVKVNFSKAAQVQANPQYKQAQVDVLQKMKEQTTGLTPEERANYNLVRNKVAQETKSKIASIMQNRQARGIAGGGDEFMASLQAVQSGANDEQAEADRLAADESAKARAGVKALGDYASSLRSGEFEEEFKKGSAEDQMNQFNANNEQQTRSRNVNRQNIAEEKNLGEKQRIADYNVQLDNADKMRKLNAERQKYLDQQAADRFKYGVNMDSVAAQERNAQATANSWANISSGLGKIGSAAGSYGAASGGGKTTQVDDTGTGDGIGAGGGALSGNDGMAGGGSLSGGSGGYSGASLTGNSNRNSRYGLGADTEVMYRAHGGEIPGRAPVPGDHPANDIVDAKLSPGEIVIPRTVAEGSDDHIFGFIKGLKAGSKKSEPKMNRGGYINEQGREVVETPMDIPNDSGMAGDENDPSQAQMPFRARVREYEGGPETELMSRLSGHSGDSEDSPEIAKYKQFLQLQQPKGYYPGGIVSEPEELTEVTPTQYAEYDSLLKSRLRNAPTDEVSQNEVRERVAKELGPQFLSMLKQKKSIQDLNEQVGPDVENYKLEQEKKQRILESQKITDIEKQNRERRLFGLKPLPIPQSKSEQPVELPVNYPKPAEKNDLLELAKTYKPEAQSDGDDSKPPTSLSDNPLFHAAIEAQSEDLKGKIGAPKKESVDNDENLRSAQNRGNLVRLFGQLGEGHDTLSRGMLHSNQPTDSSAYREISKMGDVPVQQHMERVALEKRNKEKEMSDPNSDYAKSMRALLKASAGVDVPEGLSPDQMMKMFPVLGKLKIAKEVGDARESLNSDKKETAREKERRAAETAVEKGNQALQSKRTASGKALDIAQSSERLNGMITDYKNLDDLPAPLYADYVNAFGTISTGGQATEQKFKKLIPNNMLLEKNKIFSWLSSNPRGAEQGAFIKSLQDAANSMAKVAKDQYKEAYIKHLRNNDIGDKLSKEFIDRTLESEGISREEYDNFGKSKVVKSDTKDPNIEKYASDHGLSYDQANIIIENRKKGK